MHQYKHTLNCVGNFSPGLCMSEARSDFVPYCWAVYVQDKNQSFGTVRGYCKITTLELFKLSKSSSIISLRLWMISGCV